MILIASEHDQMVLFAELVFSKWFCGSVSMIKWFCLQGKLFQMVFLPVSMIKWFCLQGEPVANDFACRVSMNKWFCLQDDLVPSGFFAVDHGKMVLFAE